MPLLDVPPFESLTQDTAPYSGFGPLLSSPDVLEDFSRVVEEATRRITETFGVRPQVDRSVVAPSSGDTNLFVRDFGSVFMSIIHTMAGGEPVFRSTTDLSHASLWWRKNRLEVLPFHTVYRRLTDESGDSLIFFAAPC